MEKESYATGFQLETASDRISEAKIFMSRGNSATEAAKHVGYRSRSSLYRAFKRETGFGIPDWRIGEVMYLLRGSMPEDEVAAKLVYANGNNLKRAIKRKTGLNVPQVVANEIQESIENIVETDDAIWVGRAFGLHFDDTLILGIRGNASLNRYSKHNPGLTWGPEKEFAIEAGRRNDEHFVYNGDSLTRRTSGYRAGLVNRLLDRGVPIEDDLLDRIFAPIDKKLMMIYRHVLVPR